MACWTSEVRERPHASIWAALMDARVLICAAIQFGFTLGSYGIGIWLPLMLKEYHLTNTAIGWIAAIPYLFASIGMILWARYVDQKGRRIANLAIACALGAAGLLLPIFSNSLLSAVIGFSLALTGVTAARAIFWTIPTRFLTGVAAAGGLAFINSVATTGGFFGPSMMGALKDFSGSLHRRAARGRRHHFCLDARVAVAEAFHFARIAIRASALCELKTICICRSSGDAVRGD